MTYSLIIKPEAEGDLQDALEWYEEQRAGLGEEFLVEAEATFDRIIENPELYAVVHGDIRRTLTKRFPYGVFFVIEHGAVIVLAVLHAKRDPKHWRERR